jgi:hypothetical protein
MTQTPSRDHTLRVGPAKYAPPGMVRFLKYQTGETAVQIIKADGEPLYIATVALVGYGLPHPGPNSLWLKGWSENAGVPEALQAAGIVRLTGRTCSNGFVTAQHAELTERARTVRNRVLRSS